MSATDNLKAIAEQLESLPDRLAALLGNQQGSGGGSGSARSSAKPRKPSAFDQLGSYELIEDTYKLQEDVGKPDVQPPKAPWGDEPDVYQTKPKEQSQDPTDAWRGKFKLPGTSLSLGSFAADTVGGIRHASQAGKQWDEAVNWTPGKEDSRPGRRDQEADPSDQLDRQGGKSDDEQSRKMVETMERLLVSLDRNTDALERSAGRGEGGSQGPGLGQVLAIAKMAGS